jgi:hypothetical protein
VNILFLGNFQGKGWDGSITDENHIADALEELGHGVTRTQRQESLGFKSDMWDMTLIAQWDGYKELVNLPHPIVYWAFDHQDQQQEWHCRLIAASDLYLSKRIVDTRFPNWQWLSQDFAPKFLDKFDCPVQKDIEVLFTGSYLPWANERNKTLKAVDEKFNLVIHSVNEWPGFKDVRPPIMDRGLPELYARAKVILSIDHTIEAGYWSDRPAQIMACGGLVLHRYQTLAEARFISGTCVLFHNKEHCLEEIESLLTMAEEDTEAIRMVGYEWAHRNLMVEHRVNDLITIVESIL